MSETKHRTDESMTDRAAAAVAIYEQANEDWRVAFREEVELLREIRDLLKREAEGRAIAWKSWPAETERMDAQVKEGHDLMREMIRLLTEVFKERTNSNA